jgi:hypothetical protein
MQRGVACNFDRSIGTLKSINHRQIITYRYAKNRLRPFLAIYYKTVQKTLQNVAKRCIRGRKHRRMAIIKLETGFLLP